MAENQALQAFVRDNVQAEAPEPAQPPPTPRAPEPPPEAPKPSQPPQTPPTKAPEQPKAEEPDEDEALQHVQGGDNRTVPFSALEKVRNDWKSKAAAEKAKADLLAQQLEDIRRQQQAPPPPPQPEVFLQPPPDFQTDPQGYIQTLVANQQRVMLNERLNTSEAIVADRIGAEELTKYVDEFKQHAAKEPVLWGKLNTQPHPYAWMVKEVDRLRAHSEIGDDPAAYRARVAAEERAKWQAELEASQQQVQQAVSPAAGLPPSLATARSVASRSAPVWTGPESDEDVVNSIRNRKRR